MTLHRLFFIIAVFTLQSVADQLMRSTAECSVPLCPSKNNTNSSCPLGNAHKCYAYKISLTNETYCAPAISCSLFELCSDNAACSSSASICLSGTCCPQSICMPLSLGAITCNATIPTILPPQCYNNFVNSDATRNVLYTQSTGFCDQSEFATPKWVRFSGAAGTRLASSNTSFSGCGTTYQGFLNDTLPTRVGETKTGTVYFCYYGGCNWQNTISMTKCINYFVYYLSPPPTCNLRYCTV